MDKTNKHFLLLDCCRGIASIWLVAFHILPSYIQNSTWLSIIEFGRIGTDFFFVASGYVSAIACHKIISQDQRSGFTIKRLKKIYSLYLYSLLLAVLIVPLLISFFTFLKSQQFVFDLSIESITDLLLYLSLIQIFTNDTWALNNAFVEVNGVYWFIAIMVQIYLLLGLALKVPRWFYPIIMSMFGLSLLCLFEGFLNRMPVGLFLPHFAKFCFGMALWFFITNKKIEHSPIVNSSLIIIFFCLLLSVIAFHINDVTEHSFRVLSALTVAILLYLIKPLDNSIKNNAIVKIALWLGRFSYSIYLNHIIFWPLAYLLVKNLIPLPLSISAPLFILPIVIVSCFISHKAFDQPGLYYYFTKLKNRPVAIVKTLFNRN